MRMIIWLAVYGLSIGLEAGEVSVTGITAQQRYPWNGLVDIVVTLQGDNSAVEATYCTFVATNSATMAAVPVKSITQVGNDSFSGDVCTRRYVWNSTNDAGTGKVDDLELTVDAVLLGGVQLWENGPYWAECNVGASKPEEYGYYFWWGDTLGYMRNANNSGWASVKDGNSRSFNGCPTYFMAYSVLQSAGYIDTTGNLVAAHDAATAYLGAPWRMPTDAEFSALISNCTTTWITTNGVTGRLVTGKGAYASKSIFLPAAGYGSGSSLCDTGSYGNYWSSKLSSGNAYGASWALYFYSGGFCRDGFYRDYGCSVRPLRGFSNPISVEISESGVTTHLVLDCRTGVRVPSPDGEILWYDASWYEKGEETRITYNGTVVATGTVGSYTWRPSSDSSSLQHLLKLEVLSGGQVVGTETAQFALGYVRNVTARQLWPHNKVALSFTVAEDIGEVKRANENLSVWCARGLDTNVATRIVGDRSAKPGVHRIIWDMEADKLILANVEAVFGVSVEEMIPPGGVQLWEDGPYWAECNIGASKPEEYGYYFWWGDTVGYKRNADNNGWVSVKDGTSYSFSSGTCPTYYLSNSRLKSDGFIDSTGNLVSAHDAATAYLGAPWRMPTDAEFAALISNCTTTWITTNGVTGRLVTGKGAYVSNSIFLPTVGYGDNSGLDWTGSYGYYWSSTPHSDNLNFVWILNFNSDGFGQAFYYRYIGESVRPLRGFAK